MKRRIVAMASAALVGGVPHKDYLEDLGMSGDRIFLGYDAVDNRFFAEQATRWRAEGGKRRPEAEERRAEAGGLKPERGMRSAELGGRRFFLGSARFVEKKNLFRLVEAFAGYRRRWFEMKREGDAEGIGGEGQEDGRPGGPTLPWDLVLLGDGEMRGRIVEHARSLGIEVVEAAPWEKGGEAETRDAGCDRIRFPDSDFPSRGTLFLPGFVQYPELPKYYGRASVFIHASTTEQWGLVVNEAMASGLPVIVSDRCGCAPDLVKEGVNGFEFDPHNADALVDLMLQVSDAGFPLGDFGRESSRIIQDWGPERFAEGLKQAADKAIEVGPTHPSWISRMLLELLIRRG